MDTSGADIWNYIKPGPNYSSFGPETPVGPADWQTGGSTVYQTTAPLSAGSSVQYQDTPTVSPGPNSWLAKLTPSNIFGDQTGWQPDWLKNILGNSTTQQNAATQAGSAQTQYQNQIANSIIPDIENWFGRAVVIVLGFIFVAAGLSMFREPAQIVAPIKKLVP